MQEGPGTVLYTGNVSASQHQQAWRKTLPLYQHNYSKGKGHSHLTKKGHLSFLVTKGSF